jgi:hypothetical protein
MRRELDRDMKELSILIIAVLMFGVPLYLLVLLMRRPPRRHDVKTEDEVKSSTGRSPVPREKENHG